MTGKKEKIVITTGKRKRAIARAIARKGTGNVLINSRSVSTFPRYVRLRMEEPLVLAGEAAKEIDFKVHITGGGVWGQANAARTAIANAIVNYTGKEEIKATYIKYDRTLIIPDDRRTEPHKPSRSSAGPRRKKQQSKR